jgi:hypothetical protein
MKLSFLQKFDGFLNFTPLSMLMYFCRVLLNLTKHDKTQGSGAVFSFLSGYYTSSKVLCTYHYTLPVEKIQFEITIRGRTITG